jgi:hypothetical protein
MIIYDELKHKIGRKKEGIWSGMGEKLKTGLMIWIPIELSFSGMKRRSIYLVRIRSWEWPQRLIPEALRRKYACRGYGTGGDGFRP